MRVDGEESTKREAMWQQSSKQETNTRERERESLLCFALLCFVFVVVHALLCFAFVALLLLLLW